MRLWLITVLVLLAPLLTVAQYYYVPQQQQRRVYYPVRTNCQTACTNNNRVRWNFRPQPNLNIKVNIAQPVPNVMRPVQPVQPVQPVLPPQPVQPVQPVQPPRPPLPPVTTPFVYTTPLPTPPPSTTAAPSTTVQTSTLPTPPPESPRPLHTEATTSQETTATTEMPTTTKYMRPERKQKTVNPCSNGANPKLNEFGTAISCNHLNEPNGGCPEDHWCHTGGSFLTTACCPKDVQTDRCDMRRETGEGDELLARWYFDKLSLTCKRFLYKGTQGNANNFVSKAQCIDACEAAATVDSSNPCRLSQPARHKTNLTRIICGPNDDSMCPNNHYCHIGDSPETTACCESSGLSDPCLLSINVGQGKALIKRYYYNTFSKRCTEFIYKGTRGNENNFLTYKDCQESCQKWDNPCPSVLNVGQRRECSLNGTECSAGQWCHFGATKETTVCCPGAVDPCEQGMSHGEGSLNLTRWFADPNDKSCTRQCKPFAYKGTKGNQNNFLTKAACELKCQRECKSPCGASTMLFTSKNEPRQCSPTSPCPNTHWCHVGITPDSTVCCSAANNTCSLPMEKGTGSSHLTRWHFDEKAMKCVKFIYRGEGGNQNMFLTQDDCLTVCPVYENPCGSGKPLLVGSTPKICSENDRCPSTHFCHIGADVNNNYCCPRNGDPCSHDLSSGTGNHALPRFYYDKETRRCREFVYQGAKGNANNFLSLEDCELVCPVIPNPCKLGEPLLNSLKEPVICGGEETCSSGFWCHIGATPETTNCCPGSRKPCDLPLETGEGTHQLERWHFDGGIQMCRPFVYLGMKGNTNNFLTKEACRAACKEINPCGYGEPLVDKAGERVLCTGSQKTDSCPREYFCHVGSSALTTLCCPRRTVESCDQPVDEGTGGDNLSRWFFDKKQNRCAPFVYGGILGNENNFLSEATCSEKCPEYRSYCPHGIPLIERGKLTQCGIDKSCPEGFICHMSSEYNNVSICCQDPMDFCLSPRDPGPCKAFEKRFGYNAETDTCVEYEYGGCDGSLNNFKSLQRCTEICCKEYKRKH